MKNTIALLFAATMSYAADLPDYSLTVDPLRSFEETTISPPPVQLPRKSPFIAVGLSYLFPGLGHLYLGDNSTAGTLAGTTCLTVGFASTMPEAIVPSAVTLQATWSYGIYAAYRDVRKFNGESGYRYKMPTDTFPDLAMAPFRFSVLKKPEVWGGFLGAFTLAATIGYFAYPQEAHIAVKSSVFKDLYPAVALPVGIGEESLFRGYLQSQLMEYMPVWAGITLSSLAFGAAHIPNALALDEKNRWRYYTFSLPLITGLGAYFGWMTHKNRSLKESVALHTWYDFVIFSAQALASHAAATGRPGFALAVPF